MTPPSASTLASELSSLLGPMNPEGQGQIPDLLLELAGDWLREAGGDPEVLTLLRSEFQSSVAGGDPKGQVESLRAQVYERRVRPVSTASFALAKARLSAHISPEKASVQAQALEAKIQALRAEITTLADPSAAQPIDRRLQEAYLDVRYAQGSAIMSRRLARHVRAQGAP